MDIILIATETVKTTVTTSNIAIDASDLESMIVAAVRNKLNLNANDRNTLIDVEWDTSSMGFFKGCAVKVVTTTVE